MTWWFFCKRPYCRLLICKLLTLFHWWFDVCRVYGKFVPPPLNRTGLKIVIPLNFVSNHPAMSWIIYNYLTDIDKAKQKKKFVCENLGCQKNIHQAGRESIFLPNFQTTYKLSFERYKRNKRYYILSTGHASSMSCGK